MSRRRLFQTLAVLLVLVLLGGFYLLFDRPKPRISEDQITKIRIGMTLDEVEAVLGCRPGNYTPRNDFLPIKMEFYDRKQQEHRAPFKEWAADLPEPRYKDDNGPNRQNAVAVRVWFDEYGKVIDKCRMGYAYTPPPSSIHEKIKKWLPPW